MQVTSATTIRELVDAYPYTLDWLAARDSHFENLRNPALFETMARFATLSHAAEITGTPAETLLDDVRTEIARHEILAEEAVGATVPAPGADADAAAARQVQLKAIILKLHDGVPVADVKAEFDALVRGVDSAEIARMEQSLIAEGMPIEDVQRLCDVHVSVFKESLDTKPEAVLAEGHSLDAYKRENAVITEIVGELRAGVDALAILADEGDRAEVVADIAADLARLAQVDVHYTRKEQQLFPRLEDHDVAGPTKVMWALDDDIREKLRTARTIAAASDSVTLASLLTDVLQMVDDMVYKEEKILFPTALSVLTDEEWAAMAAGDGEIGYAWVDGPSGDAARDVVNIPVPVAPDAGASPSGEMLLPLPTGALTLSQLDLLFRILPFDLTYVDENDRVRFYSEGQRVFPRSPGAIGREVRNCHPPKSLAKVEAILAEFKAGTKDIAEFWIEMGPKFIHIRYYALRDEAGAYKGCLEVVQEASHVRGLTGQRRIVEWGE
jgi:DUF438 domain-containing protein